MIFQYKKTNKKGEIQVFYTHSSFIDCDKMVNIYQKHKKKQANSRNWLVGLTILSAWAIKQPLFRKKIPNSISSWVFVLGTFAITNISFGLYNSIKQPFLRQIQQAMYTSTVPLWKNKNYVQNLDLMFFHLDDDNNQKPDLLHHGLSAERAQRLFPDEIAGPIPTKPHQLLV